MRGQAALSVRRLVGARAVEPAAAAAAVAAAEAGHQRRHLEHLLAVEGVGQLVGGQPSAAALAQAALQPGKVLASKACTIGVGFVCSGILGK